MKFCDNEACRCHVDAPEGRHELVYTEANGNEVCVKQFAVATKGKISSKKILNLCSVCINVVALINKNYDTEQSKG